MIRVRSNFDDERRRIRAAAERLRSERGELLQSVGVQVLSLAQQAYVEKARGGTGSDGIHWQPVSRKTIAVRVRAHGAGRQIVQERRRLAAQIKSAKGKGSGRTIARLRQRRKELLKRLEGLIDTAMSAHEIGVDTGLQRASASPGFVAGDGQGDNVLDVQTDRVTVGFGRRYSPAFDEKRPLLPETLPDPWMRQLEQTAQRWGENILIEALKG